MGSPSQVPTYTRIRLVGRSSASVLAVTASGARLGMRSACLFRQFAGDRLIGTLAGFGMAAGHAQLPCVADVLVGVPQVQ